MRLWELIGGSTSAQATVQVTSLVEGVIGNTNTHTPYAFCAKSPRAVSELILNAHSKLF